MTPDSAPVRSVRVFVSSTFRDMQAEREVLVKHVFPRLRKACEDRGVGWAEVDLRWGITADQAARGEVLSICLAEIDRCRPYFLGLLGERYGWVPDDVPPELVERQPWLVEHRECSVTELEIRHGVLNDPAAAGRTFFYFRDPAYVDALPAADRPAFREEPGPAGADRLAALKDRIRRSGLPVHENYPTPAALGELVLADLAAAIDRDFPPGPGPGPLDREAAGHEAFARRRLGVYVGRPAALAGLDAHAVGDGPPLVLIGEPGVGKSALLANWAARAARPADVVLKHFVGATPAAADWAALVARLLGELKRRFGLDPDVPDKPDELRAAFPNWLSLAAARLAGARLVLVLDGLDQLEDRPGARDLTWLPEAFPDGVRVVVSALPGRALDELARRGWPTLTVEPLDPDERKQLIADYLGLYTKRLPADQADRIAAAPAAANPLFLRTVLEELRVFGVHERLDERIGHYLAAANPADLYRRVLDRYAADYEGPRPGLVRDAMTCLWAARRGLSEPELLDLLGGAAGPLPHAHWAPLHLAAEAGLANRSGLLGFAHAQLRDAVGERYLPAPADRAAAHRRLADYFDRREAGRRRTEELPWQLVRAGEWARLRDVLTDPASFPAAWAADRFAVKGYWADLEAHSPYRLAEAYGRLAGDPGGWPPAGLRDVASLLQNAGHLPEARALLEALVGRLRAAGDRELLPELLGSLAMLRVQMAGREAAADALRLLGEQEALCRDLGRPDLLGRCLGWQGMLQGMLGEDFDRAMARHKEAEELFRAAGRRDLLATSLVHQGNLLEDRDRLAAAVTAYREATRIFREVGDRDGEAMCAGNLAVCARRMGQPEEALDLSRQQERAFRAVGGKYGLGLCLWNQSFILWQLGEADAACERVRQAVRLFHETGNFQHLEALRKSGRARQSLAEADPFLAGASLYQRLTDTARAEDEALQQAAEAPYRLFPAVEIVASQLVTLGVAVAVAGLVTGAVIAGRAWGLPATVGVTGGLVAVGVVTLLAVQRRADRDMEALCRVRRERPPAAGSIWGPVQVSLLLGPVGGAVVGLLLRLLPDTVATVAGAVLLAVLLWGKVKRVRRAARVRGRGRPPGSE